MGACGSLEPRAARCGWSKGATQQSGPAGVEKLVVTVGKSMIIDSPLPIERVGLPMGSLAETVAVDPQQVGYQWKAPGELPGLCGEGRRAHGLRPHDVRMSRRGRTPCAGNCPRLSQGQYQRHFRQRYRLCARHGEGRDRSRAGDGHRVHPGQGGQPAARGAAAGRNAGAAACEVRQRGPDQFNEPGPGPCKRGGQHGVGDWHGRTGGNYPDHQHTLSGPGDGPFERHEHPAVPQRHQRLAGLQALETKDLPEILAEPNVLAIDGKRPVSCPAASSPCPWCRAARR